MEQFADTPASRASRWNRLEQPRVQGVATCEWNTVDGTTWFSPEWEAIIRYTGKDKAYLSDRQWWVDHVHPEDMPVLERACLALLAGFSETIDVSYRILCPDGSWRRLFQRSQVTEKTPEGAPRIVSGVCLDMTEQPLTAASRASSSIADFDYHAMLENSPDLFVRLDESCAPVYMNPAVLRYLGRESYGDTTTDIGENVRISGDYLHKLAENVARVFRERAVIRETAAFTLCNGKRVEGEISFWPEYDDGGAVKYAMVQFRDQTEQRRIEEKNRLNEKKLEALYQLTCMENASETEVLDFVMESLIELLHSKSGFLFIPNENSPDKGRLLWSADHYARLEPRHLPEDYLPEDLLIQMTDKNGGRKDRSVNNGDGVTPLFVVFDGKMKVMRGIIGAGTEGSRVVCIAGVCNRDEDYTEADLRQLETFITSAWLILRRGNYIRELHKAKEDAVAASKAKDAFLANVSHELRTPLHGVLSMLQLIDPASLDEQQRDYLLTANASGKALLRIISDLLDYSCMESGKMSLEVDVFDCKETILSALNVFADNAEKKGLDFVYRVDAAIPQRLLGDEARVRQVIFNLVGNALKFTDQGKIAVACTLLEGPPAGKTGIRLTVEDTGIGIPPDKLSRIFEDFSRVNGTQRKKYSGTGLGLSIVKHLATMMQGTVTVESKPGDGTRVCCTLLFDSPPEKAASAPSFMENGLANDAGTAARQMDILVAEDDTVGRFAIKAFLERRGHRVVCVEDGRQALEALQLHPFHCLFTDIEMPNMDGLELVRHLRSGNAESFGPTEAVRAFVHGVLPRASGAVADREIPVVAVSAHTMRGDRERFLRQGVDYYISKPIIKEELNELLAAITQRLPAKRAGKTT